MYRNVVETLLNDAASLQSITKAERRSVRRAERYRALPERPGTLQYRERNGLWSPCIVEDDISRILNIFHNEHTHFSDAITTDRLIGQVYWPTRARDVRYWCQMCDTCQKFSKEASRRRTSEITAI
ncbi:hypothetical protein GB937_008685 [Aspergillus fischeri]|nr:hypothetical protein GB937_008685 [Aspergillus fischeri]